MEFMMCACAHIRALRLGMRSRGSTILCMRIAAVVVDRIVRPTKICAKHASLYFRHGFGSGEAFLCLSVSQCNMCELAAYNILTRSACCGFGTLISCISPLRAAFCMYRMCVCVCYVCLMMVSRTQIHFGWIYGRQVFTRAREVRFPNTYADTHASAGQMS